MEMEEGQDPKPGKSAASVRPEVSVLLWWKQRCQPAQKTFHLGND